MPRRLLLLAAFAVLSFSFPSMASAGCCIIPVQEPAPPNCANTDDAPSCFALPGFPNTFCSFQECQPATSGGTACCQPGFNCPPPSEKSAPASSSQLGTCSIESSGGSNSNVDVPTMSEWARIILGLMVAASGILLIRRRYALGDARVAEGGGVLTDARTPLFVFVPTLYSKVLGAVLGLLLSGVAVAYAVVGSLETRDLVGSLISAVIVAYLLHVVWLTRQGR